MLHKPFQPPRGMLQKHQPFRTSCSSSGSGNFSSSIAWPSSCSVPSRQSSAELAALRQGKGRHRAKAPPNQVRGTPTRWEGISACSLRLKEPLLPALHTSTSHLSAGDGTCRGPAAAWCCAPLHPPAAISPPQLPSAITGDSTAGHQPGHSP